MEDKLMETKTIITFLMCIFVGILGLPGAILLTILKTLI
jgi:hypothetical protein